MGGAFECSPLTGLDAEGYTGVAVDIAVFALDSPLPVTPGPGPFLGRPEWALSNKVGPIKAVGWGATCPVTEEGCNQNGIEVLRTGLTDDVVLWNDTCGWDDFGRCTNLPLYRVPGDLYDSSNPAWEVGFGEGDSGAPLYADLPAAAGGTIRKIVSVHSSTQPVYIAENDEGSASAPTGVTSVQARWLAQHTTPLIPLESFGVFGQSSTKVNDRAEVRSYSGSPANVGSAGATELGMQSDVGAAIGTGVWNRGGTLDTAWAWTVVGSAGSSIIDMPNVPDLVAATSCATAVATPGGANYHLEPDQGGDVAIPPGDYGHVTIKRGRRLILQSGGAYTFQSLVVDSQGILHVSGSTSGTRVTVGGLLTFKGPRTGSNNVLFVVKGTSLVTVEVSFGAPTTILAPFAPIELASGTLYFGALLGQRVEVHQDAKVSHVPFSPLCP